MPDFVDYVHRDRDSPGLSLDQLRQDTDLYDLEMGIAEGDVKRYFNTDVSLILIIGQSQAHRQIADGQTCCSRGRIQFQG